MEKKKKTHQKGIFRAKQSVCEEWKRRAAHQRQPCQRSGNKGGKRNCQSQPELGHANKNKGQRSKRSSKLFFFLKVQKVETSSTWLMYLKTKAERSFVFTASGWGTADGKK